MSRTQLKCFSELNQRTPVRFQPEFDLSPPLSRSERVARGRLLAMDPNYPSDQIILLVGRRLVELWQ